MNASAWKWSFLVGLAILAPAALRSAVKPRLQTQPVDTAVAQAGEQLFEHEWTAGDPLAGGDGLGPVYNANSCVACHYQSGVGGSGTVGTNVTLYAYRSSTEHEKLREGVLHSQSTEATFEPLATFADRPRNLCLPPLKLSLPRPGKQPRSLEVPPGVQITQLNSPALFGAKLLDEIPEHVILANERQEWVKWGLSPSDSDDAPVGRAARLADGHVGRFGWKGHTARLADFVQAACANELGLSNPGQAQPGSLFRSDYQAPAMDLTAEQCNQLTAFVASLPRPVERLPEGPAAADAARAGKKLFHGIGCAACHVPNLGSVQGVYSDLLLHAMSPELEANPTSYRLSATDPNVVQGNGAMPREWRTPPLWGVADSTPYMHDGRATTLEEAITLHGGQGQRAAKRFETLSGQERSQLVAFLKTLRAP